MESQANLGKAAPLTKGGVSFKFPVRGKVLAKLMVGAVFVLLAFACFLQIDYINQQRAQELLRAQIAEATQALGVQKTIPVSIDELESRLAQAKASLVAEEENFPAEMNSTVLIDNILKLAGESGLRATPLVSEPWSVLTVGEHDYNVFRFNLSVGGSFSQLVSLVSKLEDGRFKTLVLEKVSVTVPKESEEASAGVVMPVAATLHLAIYTLPRASR